MEQRFEPRLRETRWDPGRERELLDKWEGEGIHEFKADPGDPREIIAIDTPPPYASGKWHVGGAAHYAQIDMVARYFRMKGYNVLVPFYADRNGLPVEVQVEKAYKVNPHKLSSTPEGREHFLKLCREFLDKAERDIVSVWRRLGCSFQYWKNGTDSEEYRRITQATFIELYKKGLIYEAERPVNWCPRCRTSLADAELEYVEEDTYLYYIRFQVKETGEHLVVATTRPELLRSCKALVYHPGDERYSKYKGMHAVNPVYGHEMPILEYEEVDPGYGTGLVMVCSYGDQADVKMFRDLGLEPLVIVSKDGYLTEEAGPIAGLKPEEARVKIAEILESKGLLVKKERIRHSIPVCWRCKTPIQIVNSKEWFLKQLEFKDALLKLIEQIDFKPPLHKRKLVDWVNSVSTDWPISKDRYYATEIPLWRCSRCGSILLPEPGRYYRPWRDPAPWDKCPVCGAPRESLVGESKVFDTWFDSSISVLYVTHYMRNPALFEKAFKHTLRPQGQDIIRTWLYYSLLRVYQLTGKPAFKWVRITGMGLDEKGEAMHKSKGNVIDPDPFIEKYGADAFRYWAAASAKLGYDYRFSEQTLRTGLLFATKLWNIARYISSFPEPVDYELREIDKATLAYLGRVLEKVDKAYSELDVYEPVNELYQFTWNYFASHYIELTKSRAYNREGKYSELEQKAAWYTLHYTLKAVLRALAPIMPFITDAIYRELYGRSVHTERFPEPLEEHLKQPHDLVDRVMNADSAIWGYKKKKGLKLSDPLKTTVYLPRALEGVLEELKDLHRLENTVLYDEPPSNAVDIGGGVYIAGEAV
ncbi:valine--tRNA ligase [Desulfurococcus mucosus]|uniref:Valine--tRNA ligase n=1 Tax=Desulfurococcus mucosus (strain ATCC 35584 / DSM 2162 / JCM 9187 / O7/1) TaxID=765177 RepID=E8RA41_DESM0|nr:valine--tRNA ligase [Desulfurococcus mucosus]ADV65367.1 valyl-tRNA synthetase [Desulfurococcus mucosus DSM 2162]